MCTKAFFISVFAKAFMKWSQNASFSSPKEHIGILNVIELCQRRVGAVKTISFMTPGVNENLRFEYMISLRYSFTTPLSNKYWLMCPGHRYPVLLRTIGHHWAPPRSFAWDLSSFDESFVRISLVDVDGRIFFDDWMVAQRNGHLNYSRRITGLSLDCLSYWDGGNATTNHRQVDDDPRQQCFCTCFQRFLLTKPMSVLYAGLDILSDIWFLWYTLSLYHALLALTAPHTVTLAHLSLIGNPHVPLYGQCDMGGTPDEPLQMLDQIQQPSLVRHSAINFCNRSTRFSGNANSFVHACILRLVPPHLYYHCRLCLVFFSFPVPFSCRPCDSILAHQLRLPVYIE